MQQMARSKVLEQQAKHPHPDQDGGESLSRFPGKDPPLGRYEERRRIHQRYSRYSTPLKQVL